jgi:hypothetical protein
MEAAFSKKLPPKPQRTVFTDHDRNDVKIDAVLRKPEAMNYFLDL